MSAIVPKLATVGEVAKHLNVPIHRVEYVLRTRKHIKPRARAAGARCFDGLAIAQIRDVLRGIAETRGEVCDD